MSAERELDSEETCEKGLVKQKETEKELCPTVPYVILGVKTEFH